MTVGFSSPYSLACKQPRDMGHLFMSAKHMFDPSFRMLNIWMLVPPLLPAVLINLAQVDAYRVVIRQQQSHSLL